VISTKAAFSGCSSGALFSQSRTTIDKVPNATLCPTGASNRETRAVILSSPCMTAVGSAVMAAAALAQSTVTTGASASSAPGANPSLIGDTASLAIRVDEAGNDRGEDLAHLTLVAAHQHGIFERVLREPLQLGEVLVQHLDLLDAGNRLAFRRAPNREIARCPIGHGFALIPQTRINVRLSPRAVLPLLVVTPGFDKVVAANSGAADVSHGLLGQARQ